MTPVHPLLVVGFIVIWSAVMGSSFYFWWKVGPSALRRWADEEGYQILEQKMPGMSDWFSWFSLAKGSGQWLYRVRVLDRSGQVQEGLARVGTRYWYCMTVSRCPVEVRWGPESNILDRFRKWIDPELDGKRGSVLAGWLQSRRLVLGFAVVDLLLATVLLAFELCLLFVIALVMDEIWKGSLGLNHYVGRTPGPSTSPSETRMFMAQTLGFFVLYLPALVTLTFGGLGLILKKPWGYYYHRAGAVLVAVTIFAIVYTIPALLVAIQPEFKDYCLGKQVPTIKEDRLGELA